MIYFNNIFKNKNKADNKNNKDSLNTKKVNNKQVIKKNRDSRNIGNTNIDNSIKVINQHNESSKDKLENEKIDLRLKLDRLKKEYRTNWARIEAEIEECQQCYFQGCDVLNSTCSTISKLPNDQGNRFECRICKNHGEANKKLINEYKGESKEISDRLKYIIEILK